MYPNKHGQQIAYTSTTLDIELVPLSVHVTTTRTTPLLFLVVEEPSLCVNHNDAMLVAGFCHPSIIGGAPWDDDVLNPTLSKTKTKNVSHWERDSDHDTRIGVVEITLIVKDM